MRIAIVNDLALAITAIRRVLEHDGRHSVAWVARDGEEALLRCAADRPDLILLDLVMPRLDGVETTRRLRRQSSCPILIVTASVGDRVGMAFQALGEGAVDAVKLPLLTLPPAESGQELLRRIRSLERLSGPQQAAVRTRSGGQPAMVAIGASTGGPGTLAEILGAVPAGLATTFVVVQHIEARFVPGLASWLQERIPMPVVAAEPGQRPAAGVVSLACTDNHLLIDHEGRFRHALEPHDQPYRPSVDVLFHSLRRHWRCPGQAVLLTGMGSDGAEGLLALRQGGWHTIAQDAASSVVFGMPRAAAEREAAVEILGAGAIARSLLMRMR